MKSETERERGREGEGREGVEYCPTKILGTRYIYIFFVPFTYTTVIGWIV